VILAILAAPTALTAAPVYVKDKKSSRLFDIYHSTTSLDGQDLIATAAGQSHLKCALSNFHSEFAKGAKKLVQVNNLTHTTGFFVAPLIRMTSRRQLESKRDCPSHRRASI
jgi:hypothetical protein